MTLVMPSDELYRIPVIVDNCVLNELADIQLVGLLNTIFSKVFMPESMIRDEANFPNVELVLKEVEPIRAVVESVEGLKLWEDILKNRKMLSRYDAELIAIAAEKDLVCCSSDRALMKTCEMYGIRCMGTLGVLVSVYRYNQITPDEFRDAVENLFSLANSRYGETLKNSFKNGYPEIFEQPSRLPPHA
ncbi:hypothetical protein [Sulfoacidibacillus thermotolerans]|uniref:PIN domain-containing protein n=1 Tax=Sulfoacidibacillus thermotolerans TaxID=1765684 RepID=A0A2U3D5N0_SULT2|nr:hypothetical protein [Sulfoacidibacillus thermotolerans]PWI56579.1 hypothetical protein BM613_12965 [Sulfoacidibacillus thermotolerans]